MRRSTNRLAVAGSALLAMAAVAQADYEVVSFTGEVSRLRIWDQNHDVSQDLPVGSPVSGTLIVQSSAQAGGFSNMAVYGDAVVGFSLQIAGTEFESGVQHREMYYGDNMQQNGPGDHVWFTADVLGPEIAGARPLTCQGILTDPDSTVFPQVQSHQTLWPMPPFAQFEENEFSMFFFVQPPDNPSTFITVAEVYFELDSFAPAVECAGDIDRDFDTDVFDFASLASEFGCVSPNADQVAIEVSGYVSGFDEGGVDLETAFELGEPFTGTFVYDRTAIDGEPGTPDVGRFFDAVTWSELAIGDDAFTHIVGPNQIVLVDDQEVDSIMGDHVLGLASITGATVDFASPELAAIVLNDIAMQLFETNADTDSLLPALDVSSFDSGQLAVLFTGPLPENDDPPAQATLEGVITHARIVPAPDACLGDLDGDGDTDVFDFAELATGFGCGTE